MAIAEVGGEAQDTLDVVISTTTHRLSLFYSSSDAAGFKLKRSLDVLLISDFYYVVLLCMQLCVLDDVILNLQTHFKNS